MMHGYLPFDAAGKQLAPFRTWRNNITGEAAEKLTAAFHFNIPQRWSIAHLYHAILNSEEYVKDIAFLTTLAGYVHWQLSGCKVLGIGDASGMFPIGTDVTYDEAMLDTFQGLVAQNGYSWRLQDILPRIAMAGEQAGTLTTAGAALLDPTGTLQAGSIMAPPEGDAGTGMISTNAVRPCTGNISVGTSAFSMNVLEKPLSTYHRDIDIVTTPDGAPVAMVHINNCSSDLNAWVGLFRDFTDYLGIHVDDDELYKLLLIHAAKADLDASGLVNYSCLSGENITDVDEGRPLFVRSPKSHFNLPNFMLAQLFGAFTPLKIGMDILIKEENLKTSAMVAQGGLFRTPVIVQQVLSNVLGVPITTMETAGEGGPWGMAVLALYSLDQKGVALADYLDTHVFIDTKTFTLVPETDSVKGYQAFLDRYKTALPLEQQAAGHYPDHKA